MKMYVAAIASVGAVSVSLIAFFYGQSIGKSKENEKWQAAEIEVLLSENSNLYDYVNVLRQQSVGNAVISANTAEEISQKGQAVQDKITETEVEAVVNIDSDGKLSYDLVRLRNSWAEAGGGDQE